MTQLRDEMSGKNDPYKNPATDLDNKLEQLLKALVFDEWHDDSYLPSYKKAIKQAFTGAGYFKPPDDYLEVTPSDRPVMMTGQEWYDRFKVELYEKKFPFFEKADDYTITLMVVEDAARRAANLTDKETE